MMNGKQTDIHGDGVDDPDWDPRIPVSNQRIPTLPGAVSSNSSRPSVTFPPLFNSAELSRGARGAATGGCIMFTPSRSALPAGISSSSEDYWAINEAAISSMQVNRALYQHSSKISEVEPFISGASQVPYDRPMRNSYLTSSPHNIFGLGSSLQQDTIGVRTEMQDIYTDTNRDCPESITQQLGPLKVDSERGGRQEPAPTFQATYGNPGCIGTAHETHYFSKVSSHSLLRDGEKKGNNPFHYPPHTYLSKWQEENGELLIGSKTVTSPPSQGGANLLSSRSRTNTTTSQPSTSELAVIPFERYIASPGASQLDVGCSNTEEESITIHERVWNRSEGDPKPSCWHIIERSNLSETGHGNIWSEEGLSKDCIALECQNNLECSRAVLPRENQHEKQSLPEMNICCSDTQQEPVFTDCSSDETCGCEKAREHTVPRDWQPSEKSRSSAIIHSRQLDDCCIGSGYSISLSEKNVIDTKNRSEMEGGGGQSWNAYRSITFSSIPREVTQPCSVAFASQDKKTTPNAIKPLHAYNFFFYDVRDSILRMDDKERSAMIKYLVEQKEKGGATERTEILRYLDPKLLLSLHGDAHKNRLLENHWHKDRSKRRRHRKSHGKIAFVSLNQACSALWRTFPEHGKHFYMTVAEADRARYKTEVKYIS